MNWRAVNVALLGIVAAVFGASQQACQSFTPNLSNTTAISVSHHSAGSQIPLPGTVESCGGPNAISNITTDLCRIVLDVATSNSSTVRLEAYLPDTWNSRFLATGDGGIGGCIDYPTMQNTAQLGFAAFGTNAGHNGSTGYDFFLNQPEVIQDFGHRAIHVEATVGKELVKQYYGTTASKNYYAGCSTGGRQGFQEAHLHPDDFDGILVGSPGVDWLHIVASKGILARRIGWPDLNSPSYVRPQQWTAIAAAQIKLLDPLDGVTDGIIDQPTHLRFDPAVLGCGVGVLNSSVCLSPQQIKSVQKAYEPIANSTGQIVYPSFELGSNTGVFSENQASGQPELSYTILQDFWRGAVYNDSSWTPLNFTEADMDAALKINPGGVNAGETDLSGFYARGGKIMSYHGRSDETVTSALSERFFTGVASSLNLTFQETNAFYRLFFIPGMHHCSTGPGAWSIGNAQSYPWDQSKLDTEHNALLALVDWVEKGNAPDHLIGTKYANDVVGGQVQAQRKHCVYPETSKWDGKGNTTLASSWNCVVPGL